ncbi:MAG: nitroreductase [Hyphomicrobiaceae bacterium]|nr:nitroreductase [Hyphomicrobiaceae bacterium]
MSQEVLDFLLKRRSVKPAQLAEPGPSAAELETILTAAARVPDHKKLAPWRFVVFEGQARTDFGRVLLKACAAEDKETPSAVRLEAERSRLLRAPTTVAVISRHIPNPAAPEWEQLLSCGAACFNLCLAANALGFGTAWLTEWYSYSPHVRAALGLADTERIAGFIYIGTPTERQADRERPALAQIVTRWTPRF